MRAGRVGRGRVVQRLQVPRQHVARGGRDVAGVLQVVAAIDAPGVR